MQKVKFEQVFMFIYSRRVGTPADKMEEQIQEDIKHKRFEKLKKLVESQIEENNKKYIGTKQKITVEGKSKTNENMLTRKNRDKQSSSIQRRREPYWANGRNRNNKRQVMVSRRENLKYGRIHTHDAEIFGNKRRIQRLYTIL